MDKKYWSHKPLGENSILETYNSDDFVKITVNWILAKIIAFVIIILFFILI